MAATQTCHYVQWMAGFSQLWTAQWMVLKSTNPIFLGRQEVWIIWFADFWLPLESCLMIAGNKGGHHLSWPPKPPPPSCQRTSCLPHVRFSMQKCIAHFTLSFFTRRPERESCRSVLRACYLFFVPSSSRSFSLHLSSACPSCILDGGITD